MAEEQQGKVKVRRNRKRVYEAPAAESAAEALTPAVQPAAAAEVAVVEAEAGMAAALPEDDRRYAEALGIVRGSAGWSAGAGLIPLPLADVAAVMLLQLRMLKQLSGLYEVPFHTQRAKAALAALLTGLNTAWLAGSSAKIFPFLGVFAMAAMPAANGAASYAVGRVFIQHFAAGGTFLDFDPAKVKAYFAQQYREAGPGGEVQSR